MAASRRHRCAKLNRATAGGGVLWAMRLGARAGACPLKVLALIRGAWHDTTLIRRVKLLANGPAITSATGVLREHRGRGVATALKLASFRFLKERGYREARAHNDTENPPILRLNEKLGYRRLPGWLAWEKLIER